MRLPRVRFTVRRMMVAVAVMAVLAWLSFTAFHVATDPHAEQMSHLRLRRDTGEYIVYTHPMQGTFWPRYWRRLSGVSWPGSFVCPSCLAEHERREGRELVDIASSDDASRMLYQMEQMDVGREIRMNREHLNRLDPKSRAAAEKFLMEESVRRRSDHARRFLMSDPPEPQEGASPRL